MKKILAISAIALMLLAIFAQVSIISPAAAQPPSDAELTGVVYDRGEDTDSDSLYNYLVVDVQVNVSVAAYYIVEVNALIGEYGYTLYLYDSEETYLNVGLQNLTFPFNGIAIYGRELNVTSLYGVTLYDQDYNWLGYFNEMYLSTTYDYTLFDTGATLTGNIFDEAIDANSNGLYDFLQIEVEVDVADAEYYECYISGLINVSGYDYEYISIYNNTVEFLDTGIWNMTVQLPGATMYASHAINISKVSFMSVFLYEDGYSYQLDSESYLDLSRSYSYVEFETTAYFTGTIFDAAVDSDGNGKFDYLQIGLEINVTEAGEYYITMGSLVDDAFNYLYVYENFYSYLEVGIHVINMTVYGPKIYSSEINPTYIGEAEISSWSSGVVLDRLTNTPLSAAYDYADFESLALLTGNVSDMGVDRDGDGLYDYLAIGIQVNVTKAGRYEVSAECLVEQVNDTYYETLYVPLSVEKDFEVGLQWVYLNYSGPMLAYKRFSPTNITDIRLTEPVFPYLQLDYIASAQLSTKYDYALFDAPLRDMQVNLIVYPDGTVEIGGTINGTHAYPQNTGLLVNATVLVSTTGDTTIITTDGAFVPPQEEMEWPLDAIVGYAFAEYKNGILNATLDATMFMPPEGSTEYPTNTSDFTIGGIYSDGLLSLDVWGQTEIPSFEGMFPLNVSDFTVSGDVIGNEIAGNITFHAVSGLPLTDAIVYFNSNETHILLRGNLTLLYGNYFDMEINSTTLDEIISAIPGPTGLVYNMTEGMLECKQLDTEKTPIAPEGEEIGAEIAFNATITGNFTDAIAQLLNEIVSGGDPEIHPLLYAALDSAFSSVQSASFEVNYYYSSRIATLDLHLIDDVKALWSKALEVIPPTLPDDVRTQFEAALKIANMTAYAISDFGFNASYTNASQKLNVKAWFLANITKLKADTLPLIPDLAPPELVSVFESCLNTTYCTLTYANTTVNYVNGTGSFDANLVLQGDFKAELNHIKRCYIDYINATEPWMLGPDFLLVDEMEIDMNNCQLEFKMSPDWQYISFDGIIVKPPKETMDLIRFRLTEFFNATSYNPEEPPREFEKLRIVVTGGFNGTHVVLPYAPVTMPTPDAISLDYKTMEWENVTISTLKDLVLQIAYQEVIDYAGETYYVPIFTNSTLSEFNFNPSGKKIYFNVTGDTGAGFCQVIVPRSLLYAALGEWIVKIDGIPLNTTDFTVTENAEYVLIELNYAHSSHLIEIQGTWVISEFQSNVLPLVLIVASLAVAAIAIRHRKKFSPLKLNIRMQ